MRLDEDCGGRGRAHLGLRGTAHAIQAAVRLCAEYLFSSGWSERVPVADDRLSPDGSGSFWPPGYGEDPQHDSVETFYALVVDEPFCVSADGHQLLGKPPAGKITEIQLIGIGYRDLLRFNREHVRVTGRLFESHTGHHHLDVLIDTTAVQRLE